MVLIQPLVALVALSIIYSRMIRREVPEPIGRAQAVVPVFLGIVSTMLSFAVFLGVGYLLLAVGFNSTGMHPLVRSVLASVLEAALPEELAKLAMIALALTLFRSKVRNVYECILIGAAVGFGFTLFEEFLYGSGGLVDAAGRLITVAGHMAFNIVMAKHLGLARHARLTGDGSVGGERAKALLIPMGVHTLYDTFTANNRLMLAEDDMTLLIGVGLALVVIVFLFVYQIRVLRDVRDNAERYSSLEV